MIVTGFDYARHRILVIVRGATPREQVFDLLDMLFANQEYLSGFDVLWDQTLAEANPDWTSEEIRRLVEHYDRLNRAARRAPAREAVVVPKNNALTFGLARMFQMQADPIRGDVQMQIFDTRAAAEAWLDEPRASEPSGTAR